MVSASFANPLRRRVLLHEGDTYRYATMHLGRPSRLDLGLSIATNASAPQAAWAAATPEGRRFLSWSRFPFYTFELTAAGSVVRIADARYSAGRRGGDWASVEVLLPPPGPTPNEPPTAGPTLP